jgi:hypothetical protein
MRRTILIGASAALAAMALAACDRGEGAGVGSRFCTPFPKGADGAAPVISDPAAAFDDCIHRWSYSLASARDGADVVAGAAVAACGTSLTKWNQQSLAQAGSDQAQGQQPQSQQPQGESQGDPQAAAAADGGGQPGAGQAVSLTTGQSTDLIGERAQYAQSRAMFYVVQARAAHCSPPPGKPPAGEL